MNILVIGNGFDLAHGLPTKYTDFLEFVEKFEEFYESEKQNTLDLYYMREDAKKDIIISMLVELFSSIFSNSDLSNDNEVKTAKKIIEELHNLIKDNVWIDYFLQNQMYQKENWIDFESEISSVIQSLDRDMKPFGIDSTIQRISIEFLNEKYYDSRSELTYRVLRDKLLEDLNKLIRALEIYLCNYVEKKDVIKKSPDIEVLKIDHILSFNYTNTFSKLYKIAERIGDTDSDIFDYIHGKADINNTIELNNMVLGIDEYLPDDRKDKDLEFIAFKKYYQRIHKQTGCKYKEWLDQVEKDEAWKPWIINGKDCSEDYRHYLYIFGHSLDVTDKDILRDLILHDNVYTTIYYLNKDTMGQQIANLVKVIGQDELIKRTGGSTRTIEFVPQQDMISADN